MRIFPLKPSWLLGFLVWLGLIAGSYAWLLRYSFAEGRRTAAPQRIPAALGLPAPLKRPQLLLAIHPRCPCSRATMAELAKILSRVPNTSDVTVLLYKPRRETDDWMAGPLLEECRRMNLTTRADPDGKLAAALGGLTSGHVVLYDSEGKLRYQGGITAARSHEGDNAGQQAILALLRGSETSEKSRPVFGCPIQHQPTKCDSKCSSRPNR